MIIVILKPCSRVGHSAKMHVNGCMFLNGIITVLNCTLISTTAYMHVKDMKIYTYMHATHVCTIKLSAHGHRTVLKYKKYTKNDILKYDQYSKYSVR